MKIRPPDETETKAALLAQLKNEYPLVRERSVRSLEDVIGDTNVSAVLTGMMNDPVRNVRVAAAWALRATVDMQCQAGQDLKRMLDLEADQPTGQFQAALFWLSRQRPEEALAHLKKSTAWDPISPPFLCTQAEVQDQLGHTEEALKILDRAEAAMPDDPHIPYVRGSVLQRHGRIDEARIAVSRALKIEPSFGPALELQHSLMDKE